MKKLGFLIITSMLASNTFAFSFYKKNLSPPALSPHQQSVKLNDFSGVWVGLCAGDAEDGDWELRLTITQSKKQMSLTFGDNEEDSVVLNLGQLSSQSSSTPDKREATIQQVDAPYGDMMSINYESMAEVGPSKTSGKFLSTSLHVNLFKKGDTLELQAPYSSEAVCVLKKSS